MVEVHILACSLSVFFVTLLTSRRLIQPGSPRVTCAVIMQIDSCQEYSNSRIYCKIKTDFCTGS